jgi:hypothetical protein
MVNTVTFSWDGSGSSELTQAIVFTGLCSATKIIIEGYTSIGNSAFLGCSSMTSVTIKESVTTIGICAFYQCYNLTSIEIPLSVTSIEDGTFYGCSSLTSIVIPSGVTQIGEGAFFNCTSLNSISLPTKSQLTTIGYNTFSNCSTLQTVYLQKNNKLNIVESQTNVSFYGANVNLVIPTIPTIPTITGFSVPTKTYGEPFSFVIHSPISNSKCDFIYTSHNQISCYYFWKYRYNCWLRGNYYNCNSES